MITIETNLEQITTSAADKLSQVEASKLTRLLASTLLSEMRQRIHVKGLAANGAPIGSYSNAYMKVRAKHGRREPQNKVVLSLTRAMENGMVLIPIPNGTGIGYTTPELLQRARYQEMRGMYNTPIFSPTQAELDLLDQVTKNYIQKLFQ